MGEKTAKRPFIKFVMWFALLSTFGVGGGIFFLLLAVVPIEQAYTDRGWSQFKIDSVMKYYVLGWVLFGFFFSFLYYRFLLKKNRWMTSGIVMTASVALCISGMYYFLNTGTGFIQHSQGKIEKGDRFTFGPYPEKEDLEQLKDAGYDGVITLLSPTLPIEKPLLDKEKKSADEAGIVLYSLPMLPWVGDNSETIEAIKKMIQQDDKKYYVHCYLGRHRVDVVKQVINQALDSTYKLNFLQPTTFERGNLYYFHDENILVGPYPTDEEWFTRIKRGEVKEVVSLLESKHTKLISKEEKVALEMGMTVQRLPLSGEPTREEIKKAADYITSLDHKVFVHNFNNPREIEELEAYISWKKMIHGDSHMILESGNYQKVGAKMIIGFQPTANDKRKLSKIGIEQYIHVNDVSVLSLYKIVQQIKEKEQLTYVIVNNIETMETLEKIATGFLFGSRDRGKGFESIVLREGSLIRHERNLVIGPILSGDEYESFALKNGVAQLIFLYAASITSEEKLEEIKQMAHQYDIPLKVIPMHKGYEEELVPAINRENGLNYIMAEKEVIQLVHEFIKQF
ncbi:hypothetical protein QYG89_14585 [Bacillus sp. B190/17]|uniref:Uncharacterized protein n=1 Tax=Bacillus lumedeiriae TaxID=3058829 RepID=A0ABW8IDV5_9BACI